METSLDWYALCAVLLFFKMLGLSLYQGYHRIGKAKYKNPEDAALVGKAPVNEELPQVQRAQRAWQNDLENIPVFFALGLIYVLVEAAPGAAASLFVTFTVARCAHSLAYLLGLQPWRTIAYAVALLCLIAMSVAILQAL